MEVLGEKKFQIDLLPPPLGEGSSYEASIEDLRPSLDWSLERGWTVPTPMGSQNCRSCACLFKPGNEVAGGSANSMAFTLEERRKDISARAGASLKGSTSISSNTSASSLPSMDRSQQVARPLKTSVSIETQTLEVNIKLGAADKGFDKNSCSDSVSSSHVRSIEAAENAGKNDGCHDNGPLKKMRTIGSITLDSVCADTMETAIVDLEELVNKVKWIKGILESGMLSSDNVKSSWRFLEHRPVSTLK
uniref:Uncharacterized protein n=2 Tax=Rhizophora mucronata TaxID=61149 RepID=A0A2P2K9F9_RHIMU